MNTNYEKYLINKALFDNIKLHHIKLALLKFFWDNPEYFNLEKHLDDIFSCFTIDNILSFWSGEKVRLYEEEKQRLNARQRRYIIKILNENKFSFKNAEPTFLSWLHLKWLKKEEKKSSAIIYTPVEIAEYMTECVRNNINIDAKLIDPACGCGIFLLGCYNAMMNRYFHEQPQKSFSEIHEHILSNCIYGADSNAESVIISKLALSLKYKIYVHAKNIHCLDSLFELEEKLEDTHFDWVITNPPYLGHKQLSKEYKLSLKEKYSEVFYGKSDISYAFFNLGYNLLKEGGNLLYVTSRYFTQSQYAKRLRGFILENFAVRNMVDFFGNRPFKSIGIDPLIIELSKSSPRGNSFNAVKIPQEIKTFTCKTVDELKDRHILINQDDMNEEHFEMLDGRERAITHAITSKCSATLGESVDFFQGIITGADKAFIVRETDESSKMTDECGVRWIKGKALSKEGISYDKLYLLYTSGRQDADLPNTIAHILPYKERLENRRECLRGYRQWHELQWGRTKEQFEKKKILFPYKSSESIFVYDEVGYFFSADIYAMVPKDNALQVPKLLLLLNSKLYDTYIKSLLKKLGNQQYEYYPNTLAKALLPSTDIINSFNDEVDINRYFDVEI